MPWACGGVGTAGSICRSLGRITQVTVRSRERDPHGAVDQVADLAGLGGHLHVLVRDVLEQRGEVNLLLVVAAEAEPRLLADDRDDRLVVELGVIEAVEEVDRARPGGGEADAGFAGELGVGAGHEGGHLLVADLDELGARPRRGRTRP